jgi:hypothetical protein
MNSVPQDDTGVASGVNNTVSRVAALLAIAVLGAVLQATFSSRLQVELGVTHLSMAQRDKVLAQRSRLHNARLSSATPEQEAELNRGLDAAFLAAFRRVMLISAISCVTGALIVGAGMQRRTHNAPKDAVAV